MLYFANENVLCKWSRHLQRIVDHLRLNSRPQVLTKNKPQFTPTLPFCGEKPPLLQKWYPAVQIDIPDIEFDNSTGKFIVIVAIPKDIYHELPRELQVSICYFIHYFFFFKNK